MQRSMALRITNPEEMGDNAMDEDDENSVDDFTKLSRGSESDDDGERARNYAKTHHADSTFSPRKVVAEEMAHGTTVDQVGVAGGNQVSSTTLFKEEEKAKENETEEAAGTGDKVELASVDVRRAILEGNLDQLKAVFDGIADESMKKALANHVNRKDSFSPLMIAVSCEPEKVNRDIVQYLLSHEADTSAVDRNRNTCLHWASTHGQHAILDDLIRGKVEDIAKVNIDGDTPLHLASRAGHVKCCEGLLQYFMDKETLAVAATTSNAVKPEQGSADGAGGANGQAMEAEDDRGDKSMELLYAKKKIENESISAQTRRLEKEKVLREISETKVNAQAPHPTLLIRNLQCETAFDIAGTEAKVEIRASVSAAHRAELEAKEAIRKSIRELFMQASPYFKTLILHHRECFEHIPMGEDQRDVWEAPERLTAILSGVVEFVNKKEYILTSDYEPATRQMLERAHSTKYVSFVTDLAQQLNSQNSSAIPFTPQVQRHVQMMRTEDVKRADQCDTSFSAGSYKAAIAAGGSVCYAIDKVIKKHQRNAFCIVRPPGHHAGIDGLLEAASSCGFCIFNNVAIGALHALATYPDQVKKVAIVDFDVHHGNGTEEIVEKYNREYIENQRKMGNQSALPPIFFFSAHIFEKSSTYEFYPGSGAHSSTLNNIVNAPMQPLWRRRGFRRSKIDGRKSWSERFYFDHFGRNEFRRIVKDRLLPALRTFQPDLILISAGFDAGRRDCGNGRFMGKYYSGFDLTQHDFWWISGQINSIASMCCEGRVISVLEGGYGRFKDPGAGGKAGMEIDRSSLARNCVSHVLGLMDPITRIDTESDDEESEDDGKSKSLDTKITDRRKRARKKPKRFENDQAAENERRKRGKGRRGGSDMSDEEDEDEEEEEEEEEDESTRNKKRSKQAEEGSEEPVLSPEEQKRKEIKRKEALIYLKHVKAKYVSTPDIYKQFLGIMGEFKSRMIGVKEVIAEVKRLFRGDRFLIEGFNTFLPPGYKMEYDQKQDGL